VAVASAGLYASLRLIPDNHTNIPPLSCLQAGCPSCRPTNSVKALKANLAKSKIRRKFWPEPDLQNVWTVAGAEISYSPNVH